MSVGRHTAYNLAGAVAPLLLALVTVPLYIGLIGAERYGVLAVAFLFLGYFGLFDLGLGRAATYRISSLGGARSQAQADTLWTAIALNLAMGVAGGLVLWTGAHVFFSYFFKADESLRREILGSLPLLALCLPVATMTSVLTGALIGRHQFATTNLISVFSTSLFQIAPIVVAWWAGPQLALLLLAALAARFCAIIALFVACHAEFLKGWRVRFVPEEVRKLWTFGGWVFLDGALTPLLAMVDRFAIGAMLGGAAVATYTVPYQLAQRITIFPSALLNALFPRLPTATAEEQQGYADKSLRSLLAAMSPPILVGVMLIQPFFEVWLGAKLGSEASSVGVLILIAFWINSLGWTFFVWLTGTGRPDLVAKMHMIEVPPYLAALYVALKLYGLLGAGAVFIVRNMVDISLLAAASRQLKSLSLILPFAALIVVGAVISLDTTSFSWLRFSGLGLLFPLICVAAWRVLPPELQGRLAIVRRRATGW